MSSRPSYSPEKSMGMFSKLPWALRNEIWSFVHDSGDAKDRESCTRTSRASYKELNAVRYVLCGLAVDNVPTKSAPTSDTEEQCEVIALKYPRPNMTDRRWMKHMNMSCIVNGEFSGLQDIPLHLLTAISFFIHSPCESVRIDVVRDTIRAVGRQLLRLQRQHPEMDTAPRVAYYFHESYRPEQFWRKPYLNCVPPGHRNNPLFRRVKAAGTINHILAAAADVFLDPDIDDVQVCCDYMTRFALTRALAFHGKQEVVDDMLEYVETTDAPGGSWKFGHLHGYPEWLKALDKDWHLLMDLLAWK